MRLDAWMRRSVRGKSEKMIGIGKTAGVASDQGHRSPGWAMVTMVCRTARGRMTTATSGTNWVDPVHDAAGNLTTGPKPGDEATTQKYVFDAWNRLAKVTDGSKVTIAAYEYDGLNRRIVKELYTGGTLTQTRHAYWADSWQLLEERVNTATTADRQWTWGTRYIDDLILRTRDTDANGNGTLDNSPQAPNAP